MDYEKYKDILLNGERTDWYETEVPKVLITNTVRMYVEGILKGINESESQVSDLRAGKEKTAKLRYIQAMWFNVRNAPYTLNGDFYLIKKKEIEGEKEEKPKPKRRTPRKKTVVEKVDVVKKVEVKTDKIKEEISEEKPKKLTRNQELIFGKK